MGGSAGSGTEDVFADGRMAAVLTGLMRDTDASVGLVYLLIPGDRMLRLVLVSGLSRQILAPWVRIPVDAPIPVADAIRERRLVWLSGLQDIAHRYPRIGIVLPYDFMLAAVPVADDTTVWGGVVLLWPASHAPELDAREHETLDAHGRLAARLLRRAADQDPPPPHPTEPFVVHPERPSEADPALAAAALDLAERLPVGCCALDLDGRITFINTAGAELVNAGAAGLLGRRPWEALRWLNDPAFEDRYRAAAVTRRPTSFTVLRRPATSLLFELYPDATGISVLIIPKADGALPHDGPPGPQDGPVPSEGSAPAAAGAAGAAPGAANVPGSGTAPVSRTGPDSATGPGAAADPVSSETAAAPASASVPTLPDRPAEPVGATAVYQLMHLAASLAEAAGVRDVVDLVADQIVPAFGPEGLVLMSVDEGRLRVIGHRGYSDEFIEHFDGKPLTAPVADAQVLSTGVPVFFPTYEDLVRAHPRAPRYEGRNAWAFLPLIASGRPVGSLVLSYGRPRPFPSAERALLTSLAGLIAQALDRARLYDANRSLARSLQNVLLPHHLTPLPGLDVAARYLPAGHGMDIGGDFYDLVRATPTSVVAVIGDVQGHNTTAAALMGQVRTAVHAHATAGASPGDILARTNRLLDDLDADRFTSCLIAEFDLAHHRLRLASAGHPPPLLRHADGSAEVLEVPPGLLLGIATDVTYDTMELPWEPGSVLALYTDGLVEAPGLDIGTAMADLAERLGVSGAPDLDRLADELTLHVRDAAHRTDDVALLLVRRPPQ
ncbi:SpoIIE family protein phosphatase [Streptomyces sp. NPDC006553]|uniref:SpoIIE family protein phosphatase n=1 Tax=unclassified Streptomyces TaxID=2593676 RepID=UPI002255E387|nr:SpoIIE family protein phosphatase [Streptomyces sp. NBC_00233]MCX5231968.1 SpoIIE family protein phosphatase [Streptomyces sp. NBC_00233]